MKKIIIAIDGYSSCGKSTMAKELARQIGYIYIDSGAMYRSVTLFCLENNLCNGKEINTTALQQALPSLEISFKLDPETQKPVTYLNGTNVENKIRSLEVSNHVSPVAALPFVREALVKQQQAMGKSKGIVMDGRDIQTVVFPNAELKIFVTASAEVRAERRFKELQEKGQPATYETVLKNVKDRDYIDEHRKVSPLRKADDAIILDNSNLTIDEQNAWLLEQYHKIVDE
ncbi:(d)CMP kinase [Phocaeicola oris]|uniref:(d)CMP kinase n=1 Tax=Phocaeicola oris TaxID=2896850 RepID=UPI00234F07C0|nr:(d)CMP kinase [Phocaeicola oris]MCE2615873.1 (d)CMP kinase [Phocaeicola oris]